MNPIFLTALLVAALLGSAAIASDDEGAADAILQHEVRFRGTPPATTRFPLLVFVDVEGHRTTLDASTLAEFVQIRLWKSGMDSKVYRGDLPKHLIGGKMSPKDLFSPKLVIEVSTKNEGGAADQYTVSCRLTYLEYRPKGETPGRYRAIREWEGERKFVKVSGAELEGTIGTFLEREIGAFARSHRELVRRRRDAERTSGLGSRPSTLGTGAAELSYSVSWNDPDNRRNRIFIGASVGTPALLNLHFGFWGSRSFPIVAGLSGMYFGTERRGIQADVGWAFDNSGRVKQAVSIVGIAFNGAEQTVVNELDRFGRVERTTINTINDLHPYVGPAYTFDWNDFRAQAGVAMRMDSSSQPPFRFLIQVGYTPRINF